ncbi:DUF814 domain-containing protein [Candidatus Pacearchaeota archaeon]|nr:DUF814 domain-containing protein [Candidatus Pacearchaeota archaeon]
MGKEKMRSQSYLKYRWFFTSSGKLVIGGKNAEQNELLVKEITKSGIDYIVMHTTNPGSPFTFLVDEGENVTEEDLMEQAVFTGCFSQEWKKQKKTTSIDIFHSKQITKNKGMKSGTFGVLGKANRRAVELKLGLEVQEEKLRAVPRPREALLWITPGEETRNKAAKEIKKILKEKNLDFTVEEIERAMPAGGIKIIA